MKRVKTLPFIVSSQPTKVDIRCCGCKSLINSDQLRLGVREYKSSSWFHYVCFWTNCYYRNHLRGVDGNTLAELVDGFSGIPPSDKSRLLTDASSAPSIGRRKSGSKLEIPYEGSEADGDYELDDNTFDLTNLVCCTVTKVQTNLHVSIRKYFVPRGRTCAKPTKYGISLNCEQWNKLELQVDDINSAIATTQKTLKEKEKEKDKKDCKDKNKLPGKEEFPDWILFSLSWKRRVGVFASGEEVVVDIREFSEEKTFSESDRGIRLKPDQWKQLQENINNINKSLRKLS
ncbi:uncharacterized protein LOC143054351 [Mytilus galloprovincialis]|uniref:uncharacterized protein LOC143054351 n=1 Tax=Mytilus galloprovincialis TaxID=29158 RepID=UPI003F7BFB25